MDSRGRGAHLAVEAIGVCAHALGAQIGIMREVEFLQEAHAFELVAEGLDVVEGEVQDLEVLELVHRLRQALQLVSAQIEDLEGGEREDRVGKGLELIATHVQLL